MSQADSRTASGQPPSSSKRHSREETEECTHRRTRAKLTPTASSSASDEASISDDSSELSESSEEPSTESSSEEDTDAGSDSDLDEDVGAHGVVNLRANRGRKPNMKLVNDEPDIRSFLKDFLPKLKAANEELEAERQAGTLKNKEIDDAEEADGQYIEMDLGLGVLEEQAPGAKNNTSESDSDVDQPKEKDILGKLMGHENRTEGVGIQEVGSGQDT